MEPSIGKPDCCGSDRKVGAKMPKRAGKNTKILHPDHGSQTARLNRVLGQIEGIKKMIENQRYCPEILTQTRAAAAALKAIELNILERHLRHCVTDALVSKSAAQAEAKIKELMSVLERF